MQFCGLCHQTVNISDRSLRDVDRQRIRNTTGWAGFVDVRFCSIVGRAIASETRGTRFESSRQQTLH